MLKIIKTKFSELGGDMRGKGTRSDPDRRSTYEHSEIPVISARNS